jgi:outer membrane protein, multidrug efflux system
MIKNSYGRWLGLSTLLTSSLTVAGCSLAPTYEKPDVNAPAAFKEDSAKGDPARTDPTAALTPAEVGTWKTAQPAEAVPRGEWWTVFGDTTLNDLEHRAADANQNLKAAAARVKEARAINEMTRSSLFPTLDAGFGPTREKDSPASQFEGPNVSVPSQTLWRAQASASYEVDLFGRVSDSVKASNADAQQSEALFRSVQLTLQADVAQNYFNLRELDAEIDVYAHTVTLRQQALELMQHKFDEGDTSELDVARAKAELATSQSDQMTAQRTRAASEHALAVLMGKVPADFSMAANPLKPVDIDIPAGLPSSLLERRPDIAAAERAMAAANSRIGVAKSAYFPSLSLTGTVGFKSATLGDLFKWSSRAFLLGPLAGTALAVPVFDGGRRKGNLANARAVYDEDAANYRQRVLVAFQEVEDNLSDLRILRDQTRTQDEAVRASTRAAQLSRTQYTEGAVNYLDVIDSERTVLQSQLAAVQLSGTQAVSTVHLIRALGGGWDGQSAAASAPVEIAVQDRP